MAQTTYTTRINGEHLGVEVPPTGQSFNFTDGGEQCEECARDEYSLVRGLELALECNHCGQVYPLAKAKG